MHVYTWLVILLALCLSSRGLRLRNTSRILTGDRERGSGVKIGGSGDRGRLGGLKVGGVSGKVKEPLATAPPATTRPPESTTGYSKAPAGGGANFISSGTGSEAGKEVLKLRLVLPYKMFGAVRAYGKAVRETLLSISRKKLNLHNSRTIDSEISTLKVTPSPTTILNSLCQEFLTVNVSAILYLMNYESYGRSTASAQYFLQLAGYLGIPVIAWNADNSGLERRASVSSLQLQLAPSLEHQIAAMLSILERYKWHQFSIVTSQIAGHDDFIQAVRERITEVQDRFKFTILTAVLYTAPDSLRELVSSESRVMLLYSTKEEANHILAAARDHRITGENYVWVVTQSAIGELNPPNPPPQFPIGMLGVHFATSSQALMNEINTAIKVYAYGVEDFVNDPRNDNLSLNTQLACERVGESRWNTGDRFYKYLKNVSFEEPGRQRIEFTADGVLKSAELKIMNLRPLESNKQLQWEEIGVWKSWQKEGLDIKDIVWPGNSHTPPQGVPEKFHLKITFLEEPPYINLAPPDPVTGKCIIDRGVLCRVQKEVESLDADGVLTHKNGTTQCCSGFCIDLLERFSEELGFTYELVRVEDGKWGVLQNGEWNGLVAELVNRRTDMVMTSLMINSDREGAVDFTVPYLETGIAIVVAKRTGIISPTAFLEPFDSASWMLVGLVAIQVSAFVIFFFEWLSPSGFDMKKAPATNSRFSLLRSYWLVWAVLFQASVHVDAPRGFTARFMTNVWAMFAVVFLAIYTANLAAFMITREEFHEFSGLDDRRLVSPMSHKPMLKFGTVPWTHTESTIKRYFVAMNSYMKKYNKSVVADGVDSVLSGELDAFIYDGSVLDYLASQDEDCRLITMGSWYAMTGYGIAFPRNSKYLQMFNKRLLDFRENGDLERLRRYWMTGACHPGKQEHKSSDPLALEQFLSAFLLLMSGILLATVLLFMEHLYFKYVRKHLAKTDQGGCCALVSLSMGKSLTFRGAVFEAQDMMKHHRCRDPICDTHLWKTRHELDLARIKIRQLYKEMEAHGIRPSRRRRRPLSWWACVPRFKNTKKDKPWPRRPRSLSEGDWDCVHRFLSTADIVKPSKSLTRNWVSAADYGSCFSEPSTMYRAKDGAPATEIAEMETVL